MSGCLRQVSLYFASWVNFRARVSSAYIISKSTFSKKFFQNTIRVSNSSDPDQAQHFVGPDLGLNCVQKLSADDFSKQRLKLTQRVLIRLKN